MSLVLDLLVNLWRLLRNAWVRLAGRPPEYVALEVSGSLPEFEPRVGLLQRRLRPGPAAPSLERLRACLARISPDGRTRGVMLRLRGLDAGWASLEELRRELHAFRERGGRVVAYLLDPVDSRSYYLACAADEILATPLATIAVTGLRSRVNFLKDALDRVGLEAEVIAVSPYKSAGDPYVRNDFSKQAHEQAERLLDRRYEELVRAISGGRDLTLEEARARIDGAPYAAPDALDKGLLDAVCYEDELPERLGGGEERARISEWEATRKSLRVPYRMSARRRVGLVSLSGTIVRGRSRRLPVPLPLVGSEQAGSDAVVAALRRAEKTRRVAAILFHVESPGGDALASDLIWREVERLRARKPVVVLMGNVAASGGYYVSAAANHVVVRSGTVTGSIGVLSIRPVASGLYERIGVHPAAVQRGARAGLLDFSRRPTADELRVLRDQVAFTYDQFKDRVARGRDLQATELEGMAAGRVWTGAEALDLGLADEVGGFEEALRKARELGKVERAGSEVLLKISAPRSVRPAPGEPAEAVRELADGLKAGLLALSAARVWAVTPYDISED
jgi:protease IV